MVVVVSGCGWAVVSSESQEYVWHTRIHQTNEYSLGFDQLCVRRELLAVV